MTWNWQQPDWPQFKYDNTELARLEEDFLLRSGELLGAFRHVGKDDQDALKIELISEEALKTSAIEGELLNRDSVQSSLRQQLGLSTAERRVPAAERGISEMMVDLYQDYDRRLTHKSLFRWQEWLTFNSRLPQHRNSRRLPKTQGADANRFGSLRPTEGSLCGATLRTGSR